MPPDLHAFLSALAQAILAEARARIPGGPTGRAAQAITIERVTPSEIVIRADAPASYLMTGWPQGPMTWLAGKRVRFTPRGGSTPIIRTVSAASLAAGKWVRPARAPDDVFGAAWQAPPVQNVAAALSAQFSTSLSASSTTWQPPPTGGTSSLP
jgi:hypothetical protein